MQLMKFNFTCTKSEMLEKTLEFAIISEVNLIKKSQVGSFKVELHMIHKMANHLSFSKWIILSDSKGNAKV